MTLLKKNSTTLIQALCLVGLMSWSVCVFAKGGKDDSPLHCGDVRGKASDACHEYCEVLDCDWDPFASEQKCEKAKSRYQKETGQKELPCEQRSLGCSLGDSGIAPPIPFDVGDGNYYGGRKLELTVPDQCECNGDDCTPCAIVVGYHGFGETGSSRNSWKARLEPKGAAAGFISLYPTGDVTTTNYAYSPDENWAVPSCQDPVDGCLLVDGIPCDWCGSNTEDDAISTQREIDFTRAIVKWTMDNHCVDPGQIFGTGYSNGGLMVHLLARHPETSGLFKALLPMDGVDQAGREDPLKWTYAPVKGDSPWILHANEIFDRFEPYDGRAYTDYAGNDGGGWNPVWIYPPVLQIFAEYVKNNKGYKHCGFEPTDVGDRFGDLDVGGIVPKGYRRLRDLEGEGQTLFNCFTRDAKRKHKGEYQSNGNDQACEKLAICLWDGGEPGDDLEDPHGRAGREWSGGTDPGTDGTGAMDIMWRFFQWSVADDD